MAKNFTDENFLQEVIEASKEKPVLVDFFATWCGPCKMQAPIIEEVAQDMGDTAIVGSLNTEEAPQTAANYGVMSIPTLLVFRNGEVTESFVGVQMKNTLVATLKQNA
jgi:thioredoxin 1